MPLRPSRLSLPPRHRDAGGRTVPQSAGRRVLSGQLFGDSREVLIDHNGQAYRLRQTRLGKLILTK